MNNNPNPSGELSQVAINAPAEIEVPESMMEFAQQFRESMMRYSCAIREVKTKLEVLNDDLSVRKSYVKAGGTDLGGGIGGEVAVEIRRFRRVDRVSLGRCDSEAVHDD